jgi:hypothetical protein
LSNKLVSTTFQFFYICPLEFKTLKTRWFFLWTLKNVIKISLKVRDDIDHTNTEYVSRRGLIKTGEFALIGEW